MYKYNNKVQPSFKAICTALISRLFYWSLGRSQRRLKGGFSLCQMPPALRECCSILAVTGLLGSPGQGPYTASKSWVSWCEKLPCSESWPAGGCAAVVTNTNISAEPHYLPWCTVNRGQRPCEAPHRAPVDRSLVPCHFSLPAVLPAKANNHVSPGCMHGPMEKSECNNVSVSW